MRPDERGFVAGTGVESQDLVAITDKMARSILSIPQVANSAGRTARRAGPGQPNETRFPINKEIFLTRIRTQLNSKATGKVLFLARDRMDALQRERSFRKQSGQVTASVPIPTWSSSRRGLLPHRFVARPHHAHRRRHETIISLYAFQLIDARTSDIIWEDSAEIKKQGLEDAAYR